MKVNENSEILDYSRRLDQRIKTENAKKEQEIKDINALYEKKIEAAKENGEEKYLNTLKKNDELLVSSSFDAENKINSYKENLEKTKTNLDREVMNLKDDHFMKMGEMKSQFLKNSLDQFQNASSTQEDISDEMKKSIAKIKDQSEAQKSHMEEVSKTELNNITTDLNRRMITEERNYRAKLEQDKANHQEETKIQLEELKDITAKNSEKNKRLMSEKLNVQKEELNFLDNHQKDLLMQRQTDFQVRYQNMVNEHNQILSELKAHLESDVKKMVHDTAKQKEEITKRSDDSFYRINKLTPSINENEKEMLVSLKVPEYEKENVHLSVQGRGLKLTLTRRYADVLQDEAGNVSRSTKNELFSQEFKSKDILNPKKVDQKYENGVLTYRILKA